MFDAQAVENQVFSLGVLGGFLEGCLERKGQLVRICRLHLFHTHLIVPIVGPNSHSHKKLAKLVIFLKGTWMGRSEWVRYFSRSLFA